MISLRFGSTSHGMTGFYSYLFKRLYWLQLDAGLKVDYLLK